MVEVGRVSGLKGFMDQPSTPSVVIGGRSTNQCSTLGDENLARYQHPKTLVGTHPAGEKEGGSSQVSSREILQ